MRIPLLMLFVLVCSAESAAAAAGAPAPAQQTTTPSEQFSNTSEVYSDQFSNSCTNTSPYAGMNPLACYGVSLGTSSNGSCMGARGWQLFKRVGTMCYFCQPIPRINGIIIPKDQLPQAEQQGFKCGVDQADPNCMAVCTGGGPYVPPGSQPNPGRPPLRGGVSTGGNAPGNRSLAGSASSDPCLPFGPGGYDYCANPAGTQPAGCHCSRRGSSQTPSPLPWEQPVYADSPQGGRTPCTTRGLLLARTTQRFSLQPRTYGRLDRGYNNTLLGYLPGTVTVVNDPAWSEWRGPSGTYKFVTCNCPDSRKITEGVGGDFLVTASFMNGRWVDLPHPFAMRVIQRNPRFLQYDIYVDPSGTGNYRSIPSEVLQ
jgi:hypothetical protein